jgi:hypothetical protein
VRSWHEPDFVRLFPQLRQRSDGARRSDPGKSDTGRGDS